MDSKQFMMFYKTSAFCVGDSTPVRQSVVKSIVDKIGDAFPNDVSGVEMSLALSIAITIMLETMDINKIELVDGYMAILRSEVKRISSIVNDHNK